VNEKGINIRNNAEPGEFIIQNHMEEPIVRLNCETGEVTLNGDPNEAARIFWKAIRIERQKLVLVPDTQGED
jgi:hypothetical protein